jgi:protein-disulfide isomerase
MKIGRFIAVALAILTIGAAPARTANWDTVIASNPDGSYRLGNPAAPVKLVEYVSYTCPHCAHFEVEAEGPLRIGFISTGKGSVEYRPLLRNAIDIAAALLVQCGPVSKYRGNHSAFLRRQSSWLRDPGAAAQQRWRQPDFAASMRAIASDLKLYDLMETRGYTRAQADRCLANRPLADKLAKLTATATNELHVNGTPGFLINGVLQDAHDWSGLQPALIAATR